MKRKGDQDGELINCFIVSKRFCMKGIDFYLLADPVKFGDKGDIEHSECLRLLNEHMPDLMKEHKISQRLFIK